MKALSPVKSREPHHDIHRLLQTEIICAGNRTGLVGSIARLPDVRRGGAGTYPISSRRPRLLARGAHSCAHVHFLYTRYMIYELIQP